MRSSGVITVMMTWDQSAIGMNEVRDTNLVRDKRTTCADQTKNQWSPDGVDIVCINSGQTSNT
jgi:hypothetical protein